MFHQILICPKFETTRKVNCFNYQLVLMRQCTVAAPILSKQTKKGLSLGLDPAHQLKKKNKPTNRLHSGNWHGNGTPTIWRCIACWKFGFSNIDVMSFVQGLTPDFLGFDREQTPPPTPTLQKVRSYHYAVSWGQEMIWLICEHIPIAYIYLHLPTRINHSWIGQIYVLVPWMLWVFAQLKRFTLTHLLSDFGGTDKTP